MLKFCLFIRVCKINEFFNVKRNENILQDTDRQQIHSFYIDNSK